MSGGVLTVESQRVPPRRSSLQAPMHGSRNHVSMQVALGPLVFPTGHALGRSQRAPRRLLIARVHEDEVRSKPAKLAVEQRMITAHTSPVLEHVWAVIGHEDPCGFSTAQGGRHRQTGLVHAGPLGG